MLGAVLFAEGFLDDLQLLGGAGAHPRCAGAAVVGAVEGALPGAWAEGHCGGALGVHAAGGRAQRLGVDLQLQVLPPRAHGEVALGGEGAGQA